MGIILPSTWPLQILSSQPTLLNSLPVYWRDAMAGVLSVDTKLSVMTPQTRHFGSYSSLCCRLIYKSLIKREVDWPAKVNMTIVHWGTVKGKAWQKINGFSSRGEDVHSVILGKNTTLFLICCLKKANTFVLGRVMFFLLSVCAPVCLCLAKGQRDIRWSHDHSMLVKMGMRELPHSSLSQICGIKLH